MHRQTIAKNCGPPFADFPVHFLHSSSPGVRWQGGKSSWKGRRKRTRYPNRTKKGPDPCYCSTCHHCSRYGCDTDLYLSEMTSPVNNAYLHLHFLLKYFYCLYSPQKLCIWNVHVHGFLFNLEKNEVFLYQRSVVCFSWEARGLKRILFLWQGEASFYSATILDSHLWSLLTHSLCTFFITPPF